MYEVLIKSFLAKASFSEEDLQNAIIILLPKKYGKGSMYCRKVMFVKDKAFKMPMATVGIWENGIMTEEHLFWDNQTYVKQIGLQ